MHNMKTVVLIIFTLTGTFSFGQDLKCEDFRNGSFTIETEIPFKMKGNLSRNGKDQTEIITEMPEELKGSGIENNTVYGKVEWIDDCSYRLTYDDSKGKLTESQKLVNSFGGILTELIKIDGNCFHYKSSVKYNGNEEVINGIVCKD